MIVLRQERLISGERGLVHCGKPRIGERAEEEIGLARSATPTAQAQPLEPEVRAARVGARHAGALRTGRAQPPLELRHALSELELRPAHGAQLG